MRRISLAVLAALGALPCLANADQKVWTPDVNVGEISIETVGDRAFDPTRSKTGEQSYTFEAEYGLTSWWQTEAELEFGRDPGPGHNTAYSQTTSENLFQFTERGEYWVDSGFFAEYGKSAIKGAPNEVTLGPVLRKDFWGASNSLNLLFEKDFGGGPDTSVSSRPVVSYAWESRIDDLVWSVGRKFAVEPGFQMYGTLGPLGHFTSWSRQDERAGPQLFGKFFNLGPGTLEWNGGVLFALSAGAPRTTVRWQLEYEIHTF